MDILDACQAKYRIDPKRVYLTGLSTGGYGVWALGAKYPERFAALVPLCAHSGEKYARKLTQMPIWAFHNGGDPIVFSTSTTGTVKKINKHGGNAKQTIYAAIGHDCWSEAYGDRKLWDWLAKQHK
jgi:predicted peptidase